MEEAKGGILPGRFGNGEPSFEGFAAGERARGQNEGDFAMPKQKDLKRVVRARMQKTGESYTTARLHLVPKPAPDFAAVARLSDESLKKATGCDWTKWVFVLDKA